jgi:hypothetical protein
MMTWHFENLIAIPILFLMIFDLMLFYAQEAMETVVLVG